MKRLLPSLSMVGPTDSKMARRRSGNFSQLLRNIFSGGPWIQKPLQVTLAEIDQTNHSQVASTNDLNRSGDDDTSLHNQIMYIERHLTLFDLVSIGVGGTIGSGIFVLCGFIANQYAGPATCISWAIAGAAACLSGICYAELGTCKKHSLSYSNHCFGLSNNQQKHVACLLLDRVTYTYMHLWASYQLFWSQPAFHWSME